MIRTPLNVGWSASPAVGFFEAYAAGAPTPRPVHLPHDLLRHEERSPGGTPHTAYFPSATVQYMTHLDIAADAQSRRHVLEFDGVYRDAMVYVNGELAGQCANGYTRFHVPLDPYLRYGASNEIKVVSRTHDDSRWYTGVGIHREVALLTGPLVHLGVDGVQITTPDIDGDRAMVAVATAVINESAVTRTVTVHTRLLDPGGEEVVADSAPVTVLPGDHHVLRQRLRIPSPMLWDTERPSLYTADVALTDEDARDHSRVQFGIRSLQLDPVAGLRINGRAVKLRGACVHHDNGVLGAAAVRRAEERRIEILKAAGFNAVRSAHNPMSTAMLDACDRLGMLVMDETFDAWTRSKTSDDYSLRFSPWWERDVEAMVRKDINHPSVIMYSIGNEVTEAGTGIGARWGRLIAERIRALDPSRFITNAINPVLAVAEAMARSRAGAAAESVENDPNAALGRMDEMMKQMLVSDETARMTAESFAILDVAGLNYAEARYTLDAEQFPHRVIVGTETFPSAIAENWELISRLDHVIGEFTWTGWDYLGETGLGRVNYVPEQKGSSAPYPWLTAWCGDVDITGQRRPISHYRERVFGQANTPYIAVQRPSRHGEPSTTSGWSWSDTVAAWSWGEHPGTATTVEVYSTAPEVELLLNGHSLGRRPAGEANRFLARFEVEWTPGEITALEWHGERSGTRATLRTAGPDVRIAARADRAELVADDGDLAYIDISLEDGDGIIATHVNARASVTVTGSGVLEGLGSADPEFTGRFDDSEVHTFDGRALAVIRPTGPGSITVEVTTVEHGSVRVGLIVERPSPEHQR